MDVLAERSRVSALDSVVTRSNTIADKLFVSLFPFFFFKIVIFLDWLIQNPFHIWDPKKFLDTNWIFVFSLIRMLTDSNWFSHFHMGGVCRLSPLHTGMIGICRSWISAKNGKWESFSSSPSDLKKTQICDKETVERSQRSFNAIWKHQHSVLLQRNEARAILVRSNPTHTKKDSRLKVNRAIISRESIQLKISLD